MSFVENGIRRSIRCCGIRDTVLKVKKSLPKRKYFRSEVIHKCSNDNTIEKNISANIRLEELSVEKVKVTKRKSSYNPISEIKVASISSKTKKVKPSISRAPEEKFGISYKFVVGIDEAGRGPLAGPVVAAACILESDITLDGIMDSKKTTEADRERIYEDLISNPGVKWAYCRVEHTEIDEINILQASLTAMKRATVALIEKYNLTNISDGLALIDGNFIPKEMPLPSQCVIKGDSTIYSIAAASIIAKVTRDRIMVEYDKLYPLYGLAKHKGYPTYDHRCALSLHGPSPIHRLTYAPVRNSIKK